MKNYAQAILQFTGYPLEPIVAWQLKKSYQLHLVDAVFADLPPSSKPLQKQAIAYKTGDMHVHGFAS